MSTYSFSLHNLTLTKIRSRVERKIKNDQISSDVDGWINDVISIIVAEVLPESLISDGSDQIVGDGTSQIYDLKADFLAMLNVYDTNRNFIMDEVGPQELIEDWQVNPLVERDAQVYTIVGRKGPVLRLELQGVVNPLQLKFDSILPATSTYAHTYYKQHHTLINDNDPVLLPPEMHSLIVDGVMLEADVFQDHEDYERHERKFFQKLRRLRDNQNRYPNRRVEMGGSTIMRRPARPVLPPNYPRV